MFIDEEEVSLNINKKINITQSFLPPFAEYMQLVQKIWETKQLTNRGNYVVTLENKIKNYLNSKAKPLLVCNGTMALQLAIKALALKGEIITTPFSYVATVSSIAWENCHPVFVDIHPEYLTMDEKKIEAAITKNTTAILATHIYGNPAEVEVIEAIAKKHNLKVIYDAAHCFGVKYKEKSIFDFGDISICSFHATKIFHTGEGGSIFCNDNTLNKTIFDYHNFGHGENDSFNSLGVNSKMSEINAAIGLALLPYMTKTIQSRKNIVNYYNNNLDFTNINKLKIRHGTDWNYSYYPILFNSESELLKAQKKLNEHNIFPRRYFYPSLNSLPYLTYSHMPISESISSRILCLPVYYGLQEEILSEIVEAINKVICQ